LEAEITSRVGAAIEALEYASPALLRVVDAFTAQLDGVTGRLAARGVALSDVRISIQIPEGTRFIIREVVLSFITLPIAAVGRLAHWLPIRAARALALRTLTSNSSRDQPAMRTIVLGMAALLLWYGMWAVVLARWLGSIAALICLATVFVAAQVDLALEDRLVRVWKRARTYRVLRGDRALRASALEEIDGLLREAIVLETALTRTEGL
jgi:hypothetical protein